MTQMVEHLTTKYKGSEFKPQYFFFKSSIILQCTCSLTLLCIP
jgi:hypothetical protein